MPAAMCNCMSPKSGPPMNPSMASRQFPQPPCPCMKCKNQARDQQNAQNKAIAESRSGICGKNINGVQIGPQGPGMGQGQGPRQVMGQGPSSSSEMC